MAPASSTDRHSQHKKKAIHPFFIKASDLIEKKNEKKDDELDIPLSDLGRQPRSSTTGSAPKSTVTKRQRRGEHTISVNSSINRTSTNSNIAASVVAVGECNLNPVNKQKTGDQSSHTKQQQEHQKDGEPDDNSIKIKNNEIPEAVDDEGLPPEKKNQCRTTVRLDMKKSMMHQLVQRSTNTRRVVSCRRIHPPISNWIPCPWISLRSNSMSNNNNNNITCMSFDHDGVLLAVGTACAGLLLYDFDMVLCSDLKGRVDGRKDTIAPVMELRLSNGAAPTSIVWGDENNLLITFGTKHVALVDLTKQVTGRMANMDMLQHNHGSNSGAVSCMARLDGGQLLLAFTSGLVILRSSIFAFAKVLWTYDNSATPTTSVLQLTKNLILLGDATGGFKIIDWTKTTTKAFSSVKSPHLMKSWTTAACNNKSLRNVSTSSLGIRAMSILGGEAFRSQTVNKIGCAELRWVTSGGFVLSLDLDDKKVISIHASPPRVETRRSDDSSSRTTTTDATTTLSSYCQPSQPVSAVHNNNGIMAWQGVPQMTHILPHFDRRVCQERQFIHSTKIPIQLMDSKGRVHKNLVSNYLKKRQPSSCLVMHPNAEWLIIAAGAKLVVLNASGERLYPSSSERT